MQAPIANLLAGENTSETCYIFIHFPGTDYSFSKYILPIFRKFFFQNVHAQDIKWFNALAM